MEWLRFLRQIERETPPELTLHLIVDNDATHKHPAFRAWLARHPRVRQHFTPTSSPWLNLVERFSRDLTEEVVREGSFQSVGELVRTIEVWLGERNRQPQRYAWRAEGAAILQGIIRARAKLEEKKADTSRTAHLSVRPAGRTTSEEPDLHPALRGDEVYTPSPRRSEG